MATIDDILKNINEGYNPLLNQSSSVSSNMSLPSLTVGDLLPLQQVSQTDIQAQPVEEDNNRSFKQMANEYFKNYTPAQDVSATSEGRKKGKTVGEYLYNNTIGGIRNLATGLSMAVQDPNKYIIQPSKEFLTDPNIPLAQKISSIPDTLIYKPVLGQSTAEIGETLGSEGLSGVLRKAGEHHYGGGTLDTALVALPFTKAGQALDRAAMNVAKTTAKNVAKSPIVSRVISPIQERIGVQNAKNYIKSQNVIDQIEVHKANEKFSADIKNLFKNYNIKEADFKDLVEKMEGIGGKTLKDLTPDQKEIYKNLDQFTKDYDDIIQRYTTATPGNVTEIVQHGVRKSQDKGINTTYQDVDKLYKDNGFYDFGEYVDNTTGDVVKGATIPRSPIEELTATQPVKTISQILRKDNLTEGKPYDLEKALKKIEKKYKDTDPNITGANKALDTAEVTYKKLLHDMGHGDREFLDDANAITERFEREVLDNLPDEFKNDFSERFARDYDDIYQSKFSEKPTTDYGNPENPKRYTQAKQEISNLKRVGEVSNNTPLNQLNKKAQKVLKEYLTPDEWTSHLEAGSTLGELSKYMKEVQKEAIDKMRKPDMIIDSATGEVKPIDLRNTTFRLTEDGKDILSQIALENSERGIAARQFLESADLAEQGALRRISHGLAKVDKTNVSPIKAVRNADNELATERVYGNASAQDIASEWANPDTWLKQSMLGLMKDKTIQGWFDEFTRTGKPIVLKGSKPEDIRYIRRDVLQNRGNLRDTLKKAPSELPTDANPADYIPIDKYILKAADELFYSPVNKTYGWLRDLASIYNQNLLASGNYLIGNILGGLHGMFTDSGFHIFKDVADAIKTRGELIKDIGVNRNIPLAKDSRLRTQKGTVGYEALRKLELTNNLTGSALLQKADAFIQNAIAETRAHSLARQRGIKFEDRNLEWFKANQTKEDFLKYINDVKNMSYIYNDETLLEKIFGSQVGKALMTGAGIANPFIRWVDQATQSSMALYSKHPLAMGYVQGAVLGNAAWSQNEANAKGMGIDNPQSGKIYKFDPRTGGTKVTTTEMIPILTSVNFPEKAPEYFVKTGTSASIGALMNDLFSTKDKYGRVKQRSDDKVQIDFTKQVRYKDGVIQSTPELDEKVASVARDFIPAINFYNKTAAPVVGEALGMEVYQPYNNQVLASMKGNPSQVINRERLIERGLTNYTRPLREGEDIPLSEEKQQKLQENMVKRRSKAEAMADEKRRGLY